MTGSWAWDVAIGIAVALPVTWLALIAVLVIVRPRGGLLREALRLLPDVLRLVRRLAADRELPRGVRVRLALLLAYLASPSTWCPTSSPSWATPTTPSSSSRCCARWCAGPAAGGAPPLARHRRRLRRPDPPDRPRQTTPAAPPTA
nr:hypothetical protein GCM10020093_025700 [Planobispora longispora]